MLTHFHEVRDHLVIVRCLYALSMNYTIPSKSMRLLYESCRDMYRAGGTGRYRGNGLTSPKEIAMGSARAIFVSPLCL